MFPRLKPFATNEDPDGARADWDIPIAREMATDRPDSVWLSSASVSRVPEDNLSVDGLATFTALPSY